MVHARPKDMGAPEGNQTWPCGWAMASRTSDSDHGQGTEAFTGVVLQCQVRGALQLEDCGFTVAHRRHSHAERHRACGAPMGKLCGLFPGAATGMGRPWWNLLNDLGYLRYNHRHFNHDELPSFTRGDTLLAERIDNLITLTRALRKGTDGTESAAAQSLREVLAAS